MPVDGARPEPRHAGAAVLSAAARTLDWARRVQARFRAAPPAPSILSQPPSSPDDVAAALAEERKASADLLAIDGIVRRFHALRSDRGHGRVRDLLGPVLAPGARLDLGATAAPDARQPCAAAPDRARVERSRTVHVIGDFAVVISTFERPASDGPRPGVAFVQLRRSAHGWQVHDVVERPVARAVSESLANPRRPARRRP